MLRRPLAAGLMLLALGPAHAAATDAQMAWFREARFGMFIHWGLYALPAGTWKGEQIGGIGEWIMNRAKIPVTEYEQLAGQFNPVKFDADEWAQIAADAGMRYIVITSKHHDGFAMFRSPSNPYNIFDATPFHRDPMAELADACRRHGLRLCFYYSHAQDWHERNGAGNTWDFGPDDQKDFAQYFEAKVKPQVREILTQYGPIGLIWFDTPRLITAEQSQELYDLVKSIQPDCLVNSRIGHGVGDYGSQGDNRVPGGVTQGDWETPATINDTWGFKSYDHNWKPVERLLGLLVDIVSKGGNYLLNVGPTAEGVIPPECVERLHAMGQWLKVNGDSIYGAGPTPFPKAPFRCTTKPGKLFLHLFQWPGGPLQVPGLTNRVTAAYLLAEPDHKPLALTPGADGVTVALPAAAPDAIDSVVVLEIEGEPNVVAAPVRADAQGKLSAHVLDADLHGSTFHYEDNRDCIGFWTDPKEWLSWSIEVPKAGDYRVVVTQAHSGNGGSVYALSVGDQSVEGTVKGTGSWDTFVDVEVGRLTLPAGRGTLELRPQSRAGGAVMNLRQVRLEPVG